MREIEEREGRQEKRQEREEEVREGLLSMNELNRYIPASIRHRKNVPDTPTQRFLALLQRKGDVFNRKRRKTLSPPLSISKYSLSFAQSIKEEKIRTKRKKERSDLN